MNIQKAHKIAGQFGYELCEQAVAMCDDQGEGGYTIADYLDILDVRGNINIRRADNIIDAGRAIRNAQEK